MKKHYLLALCLLTSFITFSQNIAFEDANLKETLLNENVIDIDGNGIYSNEIDSNGDGEISEAEALLVKGIRIDGISNEDKIASFDEVSFFENISYLEITFHEIQELDLSNNLNLTYISLGHNNISSITIPSTIDLESLFFFGNDISEIDVSSFENLKTLVIGGNSQITSVDVTNNLLLELLNINELNIESEIDLSNNLNLKVLHISGYSFQNIDFSLYSDLEWLWFEDTSYTNLDLSNNLNLSTLKVSGESLSQINIENNTILENVEIFKTSITNLYFSGTTQLMNLNVYENNLINLDLSENSSLETLDVSDEQELQSIFIKSDILSLLNVDMIPNIEYVCIPELLIENFQSKFYEESSDVIINSFCSYSPFNTAYKIIGNVGFTEDENCDNLSGIFNLTMSIVNEDDSGVFSVNSDGFYQMPLHEGTYTIKPIIENPEYFTITPESIEVTFPNEEDLSEISQDFCITPNGEISEVEVTLIPIGLARPGFDAKYKIVFKNIGNQIISGELDYSFDDSIIDFVNANPLQNEVSEGNISWNFEDLLPFESRSVLVTLNLNSPQEDPALVGGEFLSFEADINFIVSEDQVGGDSFNLKQEVVNSYDPNDKTCLEGDILREEMIGSYLTYRIRFENTGTASAVNIVVEDEINPAMFDISTIRMIDASHECVMRTEGNTVKFFFDDILLSHEDEINDGYVVFKIKTLSTLELENTIENTAKIYFDFNDAIITNTVITTVKNLDVDSFGLDNTITIFPNPTSEILNISSKNRIEKAGIYSILGKQVAEFNFESKNQSEQLNIKTLETGVYMLKVQTLIGEKLSKLIIE